MQFYCKDYLSSSAVQRMSLAAQGAYMRLLCYQWEDGFLPLDHVELARLVGLEAEGEQWQSIWRAIAFCFSKDSLGLFNPRCRQERDKALAKVETLRSNASKRGNSDSKEDESKSKAEAEQKQSKRSSISDTDTDSKETSGEVSKQNRTAKVVFAEFRAVLPGDLLTKEVSDELAAVLSMRSAKRMGQWTPDTVKRLAKEWGRKSSAELKAALSKTATFEWRAVVFDKPPGSNGLNGHRNGDGLTGVTDREQRAVDAFAASEAAR